MNLQDVLSTEAEERHEYLRTLLAIFAGWFAFFATTVVAAVAWAISTPRDKEGNVTSLDPIILVAVYYGLQVILGLVACLAFYRDIIHSEARVKKIADALARGESLTPESPVPSTPKWAMCMMILALVAFLPMLVTAVWYIASQYSSK